MEELVLGTDTVFSAGRRFENIRKVESFLMFSGECTWL